MHRERADIVIGSRYIPGGGTRNWPLGRLVLSRLACVLARPLTPVQRRDVRVLPDSPRPRARRPHLGRRLQDLPGAAGSRPARLGRRSALRVRGPDGWREQDEPQGGGRLSASSCATCGGSRARSRRCGSAISRISPGELESLDARLSVRGRDLTLRAEERPRHHLPDDRLLGERQPRDVAEVAARCTTAAGRSGAWRG